MRMYPVFQFPVVQKNRIASSGDVRLLFSCPYPFAP
jgi:hypothetical protein